MQSLTDSIQLHTFFSTKAMIIFLFLTIAISILITLIVRPREYEKSRFHVFMSVLGSVAVVLIGLSLVISALTFEDQQDINSVTITQNAGSNLWLRPMELIINSKHARTDFIKSFFYNNIDLYSIPEKNEGESILSITEEQNISMTLIESWENFLTIHRLDRSGILPWVCSFLQWAQSPYLKKYFDLLKYNFKDTTISLGDLLFEYAEKLPIPTPDPESYLSLGNQLIKDERFIKILKIHLQK